MFDFSSCQLYGRSEIKSGTARLTTGNSAKAVAGSKICIITGDDEFRLVVGPLVDANDSDKDNIIVSPDTGITTPPVAGQYRTVSEATYKRAKAFGSKKAKLSAVFSVLSILSAAGASIAASQKDTCSGFACVKPYTWYLIALAVVLSFIGWYKDNVA